MKTDGGSPASGEGAAAPTGARGRTITIVDGLIASGAPEALEAAAAAGQRPWILLHMPLLDHPELEIRALSAAAGVICTSGSVAAEITRRHGTGNVHVALPGTGRGGAGRRIGPAAPALRGGPAARTRTS